MVVSKAAPKARCQQKKMVRKVRSVGFSPLQGCPEGGVYIRMFSCISQLLSTSPIQVLSTQSWG